MCINFWHPRYIYVYIYIYIYILTHSMVQSPSGEVKWFAARQEIPRISRNPKVHYRTHKRPPPVSILGQPNPVHIPTSHLLQIHPNIIHPSTPRSPQWSLSLRFPHQAIYIYIYINFMNPLSIWRKIRTYKSAPMKAIDFFSLLCSLWLLSLFPRA